MEDKRWKVYVHTNKENGKRYVGITSRERVEIRWANGRGYNENPHFRSAIEKYGWDGFTHEVLFDDLDCESAKAKEIELIALWRTQDPEFGYNMTSGGDGTPGYHPSEETRAKQSFARRRENLSPETIKRKSEAMHNRRLSDDHKRKIGEGNCKRVNMYSKDGIFIREFKSATHAAKEMDIHRADISSCCHGRVNTAGGYIWEFVQ